jgi:hypothetical protein
MTLRAPWIEDVNVHTPPACAGLAHELQSSVRLLDACWARSRHRSSKRLRCAVRALPRTLFSTASSLLPGWRLRAAAQRGVQARQCKGSLWQQVAQASLAGLLHCATCLGFRGHQRPRTPLWHSPRDAFLDVEVEEAVQPGDGRPRQQHSEARPPPAGLGDPKVHAALAGGRRRGRGGRSGRGPDRRHEDSVGVHAVGAVRRARHLVWPRHVRRPVGKQRIWRGPAQRSRGPYGTAPLIMDTMPACRSPPAKRVILVLLSLKQRARSPKRTTLTRRSA